MSRDFNANFLWTLTIEIKVVNLYWIYYEGIGALKQHNQCGFLASAVLDLTDKKNPLHGLPRARQPSYY